MVFPVMVLVNGNALARAQMSMVRAQAVRRRSIGRTAQSDDREAQGQPQGQNGSHRFFPVSVMMWAHASQLVRRGVMHIIFRHLMRRLRRTI
jgi:hypothetical protein